MKVRYLATYSGPSYGSWDALETMDAFASIEDAQQSMRRRQTWGYDYVTTYRMNADQLHVMWNRDARMDFPGNTTEDTMELYKVCVTYPNGQLFIDSPSIRLTVGPRGGIVKENY